MRFLSLFSGIGGFDIGFERAGMECVGQVELDPFCNKVLAKHWPNVKRMGDIRDVKGTEFGLVDLICGGFPCQPFSNAGKRQGKADDRYLWPEMLRVISAVRPRWICGENVPGIIGMALDQVFSDLENLGYQCTAFIIPACAVDAPHRRDRLWIMAYSPVCARERGKPQSAQRQISGSDEQEAPGHAEHVGRGRSEVAGGVGPRGDGASSGPVSAGESEGPSRLPGGSAPVADAAGGRGRDASGEAGHAAQRGEDVADPSGVRSGGADGNSLHEGREAGKTWSDGLSKKVRRKENQAVGDHRAAGEDVSDSDGGHGDGREHVPVGGPEGGASFERPGEDVSDADGIGRNGRAGLLRSGGGRESEDGSGRSAQSFLGGTAYGFSSGLDRGVSFWADGWEDGVPRVALKIKNRVPRLKALGNAVVPQVVEEIGRCILAADAADVEEAGPGAATMVRPILSFLKGK